VILLNTTVNLIQCQFVSKVGINLVSLFNALNVNITQFLHLFRLFLQGSHEGHNVFVSIHHYGNYNCEVLKFFKRSGFCSKHSDSIENPHLKYLDSEICKKAIFVSYFIFSHLNEEND
jgi:hypothetical protein